jgi:hypothetical protein
MIAKYSSQLLSMLDVLHPLMEEGDDVLILNPVKNFFPIAARLHQVHLPQTAHMMRHRRFAYPNSLS